MLFKYFLKTKNKIKMKTIKILLTTIVIAYTLYFVQAQSEAKTYTSSGLYLTYDDFINHKLSYDGSRMVLNNPFRSKTVTVVADNKKKDMFKNDVYGFQNSKKEDYRFINNESYKIVDTASFYIYYTYKQEEINKGKGLVKTDEYFFSVKGNSTVYLLTIGNLKKAFAGNDKFHYLIDATFKTDKDLLAYDDYLKTYKIKYLYNQSLK